MESRNAYRRTILLPKGETSRTRTQLNNSLNRLFELLCSGHYTPLFLRFYRFIYSHDITNRSSSQTLDFSSPSVLLFFSFSTNSRCILLLCVFLIFRKDQVSTRDMAIHSTASSRDSSLLSLRKHLGLARNNALQY